MPPYMPYTPPSNPEDLTPTAPPESTAAEFEKNVGCSSRIIDEDVHDAHGIYSFHYIDYST